MSAQFSHSELVQYFKEPIKVSVAYLGMYFVFLGIQSGSKFYLYFTQNKGDKKEPFAKVKYGSTDRLAVMGDRTVGNALEQSIPFLTSLWLHALFISPESAGALGWKYIAFRSIYPFVFYKGSPWLFLSTFPGYYYIWELIRPVYSAVFR